MSQPELEAALAAVLHRVRATKDQSLSGVPHWADTATGRWETTPDGDWTGGGWVGELWLSHLLDPEAIALSEARAALELIAPRVAKQTVFKGFGFYEGAVLGHTLFGDERARELALAAADSLAGMYDERLGLIPLGDEAEEASAVGNAESSIDSLQASPLLFWAATQTGDERFERVATEHTRRVLENHVRDDGSVIQSSTLDPGAGTVLRTHTHKGYSDTSIWGRAQAWAMVYSAHAALHRPDNPLWAEYARASTDWWISRVPEDAVCYWDFDDPAIPGTNRDTAATSIALSALLRLGTALPPAGGGAGYLAFAEKTALSLARDYLTPVRPGDTRPEGMLTAGCFTKRGTVRAQDAVDDVELIFGSYFFFSSLAAMTGALALDAH